MDPSTQCLVVIYIGYWSLVDSLQWDIKSTLELEYEGTNIPTSHSGPHSMLIYLVDTDYEVWIGFRFTLAHKDILVNMQGCLGDSKQDLQIEIID